MGTPRPKNLVVVLLDSLNRHMLEAYGGDEFATPNIAGFAERSLRFTRHHVGSLPCIPARHDILVGALDFPWRPWGSIEIWEDAITRALRARGVTTMLVSDHPHLFEVGGENYHSDFNAWRYERGHESDPWQTTPDPTWVGAPTLPVERTVIPTRTTIPAPTSAPRRISPDRGPCRPRRAGSAPRPRPTIGSFSSSMSSIRTSRSTRHCRMRGCTTRRGTARWPSGRPTSWTPSPVGSSTPARRGTSEPTTAPN